MKLQTKLLLIIIPIILIPMCLLGSIAYEHLRVSNETNTINKIDILLSQAENEVDSIIRNSRANIELFSNSRLLQNYLLIADEEQRYALMQPSLIRLFASYQKSYPEYYEIRVIMPDGYEDTRSTLGFVQNKTEEEKNTPFFLSLSKLQESIFSAFLTNPDNGQICLLVSKKMKLLDHESNPILAEPILRGYLTVTISLTSLEKLIQNMRIGEEGFIFLTDSEGQILFHPDPSQVNQKLSADLFDKLFQSAKTGTITKMVYNGQQSLLRGVRIRPDLYAFAQFPELELFKASQKLGLIVAGISLVTILLTIGLIFFSIRSFVLAPIKQLNNAMKIVGAGDFDADLPPFKKDEIGQLMGAFDGLVTDLNASNNKVKKYTEKLESEIRARTAELTLANQELQKDMIAIREAEKALRDSEELRRSFMSSATDGFILYDSNLNVMDMNKAAIDIFRFDGNVTGKNMKELFPLAVESGRYEKYLKVVDSGQPFVADYVKYFSGQRDLHLQLKAFKIHDGLGVIVTDITKMKLAEEGRKNLEAQLLRVEKMEAIGTLAGGVAHDLNNILSGIVSYPELLLMDLPQDSPLKKPILIIQKSGEKAAAIVQDLLTLARRGVAVKEVVNLNHIISDYFKSPEYEKLVSFHPKTQIETLIEDDILQIEGSSVHLAKTIMNLVSNAAEAMLNGGKITISTKNQYIDRPIRNYDEVKEGDYVVLNVVDNGIGISPEDLERIFEPFYTKKAMGRSGTGLGMAVVWGTVKDHDGYIDVKSIEGKGTTFTLYFPVTRKEMAKDESLISIENYMGNGESIMVIDDVEEQREIASVMLRKLGYSVTSVSSGEEAVEYMKNNSADLLVLDMIMDPGINGRETYERITKFHPKQKAIIASGFSETDDVKKAQELGAGQYIKKPYTVEKIGIAVRDELKK